MDAKFCYKIVQRIPEAGYPFFLHEASTENVVHYLEFTLTAPDLVWVKHLPLCEFRKQNTKEKTKQSICFNHWDSVCELNLETQKLNLDGGFSGHVSIQLSKDACNKIVQDVSVVLQETTILY